MARPNDIQLKSGYAKYTDQFMVDVTKAGQNGPSAWLGNLNASATYIRKRVVPILLEAPTGFQLFEDPNSWVATLKALVEELPQNISGLDQGYDISYEETAVGMSGELQYDPTQVRRAQSQVEFSLSDKYGMPISRFLKGWVDGLIMHPETQYATVVSQDNVPTDLLPDQWSMTCLFFEPDPTFQFVYKAWLITNMAPKNIGDLWKGDRDITGANQKGELSIPWTGTQQCSRGVELFAQDILKNMNKTGMNPNFHKAFIEEISADVKRQEQVGYDAVMSARAAGLVVP